MWQIYFILYVWVFCMRVGLCTGCAVPIVLPRELSKATADSSWSRKWRNIRPHNWVIILFHSSFLQDWNIPSLSEAPLNKANGSKSFRKSLKPGSQKRAPDPLQLELAYRATLWVLRIKPRSSGRTTGTPNPHAISSGPAYICFCCCCCSTNFPISNVFCKLV